MNYLIIHGAGMEMRGKAQIDVFGPMTLPEYDEHIRAYAEALGLSIEIFATNSEGALIDRLYQAHADECPGAIINPAGFTVGYPALCAAIAQVSFPVYELHMSNPAARGRLSEVGAVATGVITGFGIEGYRLALAGLSSRQAS